MKWFHHVIPAFAFGAGVLVGMSLDHISKDSNVEVRIAKGCATFGRFEADGRVWDCALRMSRR